MRLVTATLRSASPLIYGKYVSADKKKNETHEAFEKRTWKEKAHYDKNGLFIPGNALKNMLKNTAKFLSEGVPGKGKATFTKNFEAGIQVFENIYLKHPDNKQQLTLDNLIGLTMHVPSDGKTGGTKRVHKTFPQVMEWEGTAQILVIDQLLIDYISKVEDYLDHGGKFIGLLTFRPRQGGQYGRFELIDFKHSEVKYGKQ